MDWQICSVVVLATYTVAKNKIFFVTLLLQFSLFLLHYQLVSLGFTEASVLIFIGEGCNLANSCKLHKSFTNVDDYINYVLAGWSMNVLYAHNVKRMLLRCKPKYLKLGSAKIQVTFRLTVSMHICLMILLLTVQLHCFSSWNLISVILFVQSKAMFYFLCT